MVAHRKRDFQTPVSWPGDCATHAWIDSDDEFATFFQSIPLVLLQRAYGSTDEQQHARKDSFKFLSHAKMSVLRRPVSE